MCLITACTFSDIIIPPNSVNVSLKGVAEFNCTATASTFIWKANGQVIVSNDAIVTVDETNEVTVRMSTLRVMVTSIDNSSNITCEAITLTPFAKDESDPALLLVQGIMLV